MKSRKRYTISSLCAELTSEDGIDPRKICRKPVDRKNDRKTYQVCKQAERTLNLLTATGELGEPLLREIAISAVIPAPDSTHLLVVVEPATTDITLDEQAVIAALNRVKGPLRAALASVINRKRTPQLSFPS